MRPIDADAFAIHVALYMAENAYLNDTALDVLKKIAKWLDEEPTLDLAPVVHGEWTLVEKFFTYGEEGEVDSDWYLVCSECGRKVPVYEYWPPDIDIKKLTKDYPYCHCGAKMDGGKKDETN